MHFFMPTAGAEGVLQVTAQQLASMGVHAVLLDVDNTLTRHDDPTPFPGTQDWVNHLRENGFKVIIVSNNNHDRVAPFAAKYSLPFCSMALKPLPVGYLKAARRLGVRCRECAVIGDQIFTDIIGANLVGMKSVLLTPIEPESGRSFRIRRSLERRFRKKLAQN